MSIALHCADSFKRALAVALDASTVDRVTALLGRTPRGLEEVAVWRGPGEPSVIRVASLVDDTPFPTLYWLIDPTLNYAIDTVEAGGLIQRLQAVIDADPALQRAMAADHRAHIARRHDCMSQSVRTRIAELGYTAVFEHKGIGGISDFGRIRCLHTWYAAHLVQPNTVGHLLDQWWAAQGEPA
jgi:hypothetical protein